MMKIIPVYNFFVLTSVSDNISILNLLIASSSIGINLEHIVINHSQLLHSAETGQGTDLRPGKTRFKSHLESWAFTHTFLMLDD